MLYFHEWKRTSPEHRADRLLHAASILRDRKFEFDAWLVVEAGKTWPEAEAEVAEAIDFCEYYAREMVRLADPPALTQLPGERDELIYLPLGAGVVIPPWNFSLAILAGMTVAALVAGNTVVIKPSSETPVIAHKFCEVLLGAGFPPRSFNLCMGSGAVVGDILVEHPKTRFIAFTGSRDVGLRIHELAAKPRYGQIWIKRVSVEMGGKDAIIVDREADLESAVAGVVQSAFGYSGQKCSACSRAIVDDSVYDEFLEKLRDRVEMLKVGPPEDRGNALGPVISASAQRTILEYMEIGKTEGRLLNAGAGARGQRPVRTGISSHPRSSLTSTGAHVFFGKKFSVPCWPSPEPATSIMRWSSRTIANTVSRSGLYAQSGKDSSRPRGILRGQSLYQSEMHGRHGGRTSVRWIQYVGHGFEGRRSGLLAPISAGEIDRREAVASLS